MSNRLLLLSNSLQYGRSYLEHAESEIRQFLGSARRIAFIPFAVAGLDAYEKRAQAKFQQLGYELTSVHRGDAGRTIAGADAIFIGGGNTFRLLYHLYRTELLQPVRSLVNAGAAYIGSSAGSIVAGPTIMTTKDMPILEPPSFDALGLVSFQISPHYLDPDPNSTHMGETQEERILQFLEENDAPVIGLREGSMLLVENGSVTLKGEVPARLFHRRHAPVECPPGPVAWP